jgi:uncharacterized protein (DUF305 family)
MRPGHSPRPSKTTIGDMSTHVLQTSRQPVSPETPVLRRRADGQRVVVLCATAAVVVALASCGADAAGHNQADTDYAGDLVAQHAQTVHLLNLSVGRPAVSAEAGLMADAARTRHLNELATGSRMLRRWSEEVPETGLEHSDEGRHVQFDTSIPGVLSGQRIEALENKDGPTFERQWLRDLIVHEKGAIKLAATEAEDGQNANAVEFAKRDKAAHESSLRRLRGLLTP